MPDIYWPLITFFSFSVVFLTYCFYFSYYFLKIITSKASKNVSLLVEVVIMRLLMLILLLLLLLLQRTPRLRVYVYHVNKLCFYNVHLCLAVGTRNSDPCLFTFSWSVCHIKQHTNGYRQSRHGFPYRTRRPPSPQCPGTISRLPSFESKCSNFVISEPPRIGGSFSGSGRNVTICQCPVSVLLFW